MRRHCVFIYKYYLLSVLLLLTMSPASHCRPRYEGDYSSQEEGSDAEGAEYDEDEGAVDDPHAPAHIYFFDRIPNSDDRYKSMERQQEIEHELPHLEDPTNREFHDKYFAMASDLRRSVSRNEVQRTDVDVKPSRGTRRQICKKCVPVKNKEDDEQDDDRGNLRLTQNGGDFVWKFAQRFAPDKSRRVQRRPRASDEDDGDVEAQVDGDKENEDETIDLNDDADDREAEEGVVKEAERKMLRRTKLAAVRDVAMCNHEPGVEHPECDVPVTTSCKPTCCDLKPHHRAGAYNRCRVKTTEQCICDGNYALSTTSRAKFTTKAPDVDETW